MDKNSLAKKIADTAILHGDFTLRSGRKSTWYIDKYLFTTQPDILFELGKMFAENIPPQVTLLAGAELGGIPLVTSAAIASHLPCIFIRNQKKEYGTLQQLEGNVAPNDSVVIVEDVATTGGQVLEAAEVIKATGAVVERIIAVVDRGEGAKENIESAGYDFISLFTAHDFGIVEAAT